MTDDELSEHVATWCEKMPSEPPNTGGVLEYEHSEKGFWAAVWLEPAEVAGGPAWVPAHDFARDLNPWQKVHALLEERDQWVDWLNALCALLLRNTTHYLYFQVAAATPRQRCEALVAMAGDDPPSEEIIRRHREENWSAR